MKPVNLKEEKKLWKRSYKFVAGLDESGRGPLAGPVISAAIMINPNQEAGNWKQILNSKITDLKIWDSKKLSQKRRQRLYKILTNHPRVWWGIGRVSEKVIDKINILEASKLAMKKAIKNLEKKLKYHISCHGKKYGIDFLILDGNFELPLNTSQKSIIKADQKVLSCAIASIIAKVSRDRIMQRYHKKYPQYGFDRHKGYPTKLHLEMLKKYGPCQIHRQSFKPVREKIWVHGSEPCISPVLKSEHDEIH